MFPIQDSVPSRSVPVVTRTIIFVNALVFFFELMLPQRGVEQIFYLFGIVPARFTHSDWAAYVGFPVDTYWLDAGWFEGGWPYGVGNWFAKREAFPRGLRPLSDAVHSLGMRFLVWFEPECVAPGTRPARDGTSASASSVCACTFVTAVAFSKR